MSDSIEVPLRRGGKIRVFPNFVAEGRRAELADGVRRCDGLYRHYYRGPGDTLPEARCHVLLSSMGVDDEEDADDHPTDTGHRDGVKSKWEANFDTPEEGVGWGVSGRG